MDRLEESLPGLVRLPDTEREVRRLRETLDRMYRIVDEVQGRFGAFPGAGLLLRRGQHGADLPLRGADLDDLAAPVDDEPEAPPATDPPARSRSSARERGRKASSEPARGKRNS
jgi:hypothetical protein